MKRNISNYSKKMKLTKKEMQISINAKRGIIRRKEARIKWLQRKDAMAKANQAVGSTNMFFWRL